MYFNILKQNCHNKTPHSDLEVAIGITLCRNCWWKPQIPSPRFLDPNDVFWKSLTHEQLLRCLFANLKDYKDLKKNTLLELRRRGLM